MALDPGRPWIQGQPLAGTAPHRPACGSVVWRTDPRQRVAHWIIRFGVGIIHPVHGLRKAPKCGGPQFFLNIIGKNDAPWIFLLRAFDSRDMPAGQRPAGHWGPFFLTHRFLNP